MSAVPPSSARTLSKAGLDLRLHLVQAVEAASGEGDGGSGAGKHLGEVTAETAGGARYEGDAAGEVVGSRHCGDPVSGVR